ncbi:MAG: hypothetical protein KKE79_08595 [Actinobacteria bacterium]|nr:hypothetical protein [Actinomycetota bacterium]
MGGMPPHVVVSGGYSESAPGAGERLGGRESPLESEDIGMSFYRIAN